MPAEYDSLDAGLEPSVGAGLAPAREGTSPSPTPSAPDQNVPEPQPASPWKAFLLHAAPLLVLLVLFVALPLARGTHTLVLRDILNSHMPMKWSQANALRSGYFPIIDPHRAGGQPLAGNPNAVPFYPDNVLYLVGSPFWALNAHFWIHLLLAPLAFFWMARSWGLGREAAWAAAVCYTASGFFLSHLNFYNLIGGAVLMPSLVAAGVRFATPGSRRGLLAPGIALLWALLILAGDPLMGLLAFALAVSALATVWREGWRPRAWPALGLFAAAFACGTLLALPQIVEFLRILPTSFRGFQGYNEKVATLASWDPYQIAEWFLPLVFGRPDIWGPGAFWAGRFFTGVPAFYLSFYPGVLALALVAASGRPRSRAQWWALGVAAAGLFFALGRFNPAAEWLLTASKQSFLRYPVKFWPPVAVGAALLCGVGFERLRAAGLQDPARRTVRRVFGVLALAYLAFLAFLALAPEAAEAWIDTFINKPPEYIVHERQRWISLCGFSLTVLALLGLALRLTRRSWAAGGALLLGLHALGQLWILRPLYPMDAVQPYLIPPPALAYVPKDATVVHPDFNYLFGPSTLRQGRFPERHVRWLERRSYSELYPFTAPIWGRRYELNVSPEGLDTFTTRMAQGAVGRETVEDRFRLLAAWGVGRVLLNHRLPNVPPRAWLVATLPSFGQTLYIFEVRDRAPEAFLARRVFRGPHLQAGYDRMTDPGFDPKSDVFLFGKAGQPEILGGGTARILRRGPESYEIETDVQPGGAVLVLQRADLLFKATVDGRPAEVLTANTHRIGVRLPAGRHTVRFFIDRRPFHLSLAGSALGLLLLPALAWWGKR
jgi:hypothetical protein